MRVVRAFLPLVALTRRIWRQATRRAMCGRPVIPIPTLALLLALGGVEVGP